jgi:hypothetical protein
MNSQSAEPIIGLFEKVLDTLADIYSSPVGRAPLSQTRKLLLIWASLRYPPIAIEGTRGLEYLELSRTIRALLAPYWGTLAEDLERQTEANLKSLIQKGDWKEVFSLRAVLHSIQQLYQNEAPTLLVERMEDTVKRIDAQLLPYQDSIRQGGSWLGAESTVPTEEWWRAPQEEITHL